MIIQETQRKKAITDIKEIIAKGGPTESEYEQLENALVILKGQFQTDTFSLEMAELLEGCGFLNDTSSIMGHIKMKPHGYAGDFEIIERIYQDTTVNSRYDLWDTYSLQHPAARAVRNRKQYFKTLITQKLEKYKTLKLLNVASGPARDLYEVYKSEKTSGILKTTCVEMDPDAVAFAKKLTMPFASQIQFINKNIFRYTASEEYDLI